MKINFIQPNIIKEGKVLLIGRPNVGKSTFVNTVIGQKVAITSPKPQTTRFPIKAIYKEERGAILFVDTPGLFGKTHDLLSRRINEQTYRVINDEIDVVIYMIDHTRKRDFEEAHVLGIVRKIHKPILLVVNKIDDQEKSFLPQYMFMEEEFKDHYQISSLKSLHIKPVINRLFELLPEKSTKKTPLLSEADEERVYPIVNIDSKTFIAELIREKVFLMMGEEIPYTTTVVVDEIKNRSNDLLYIKARMLTTTDRYKKMLIGAGGRKIKEVGSYARKEIALATGKKVYLDLTIHTDPHWQEIYY